MISFKRHIDLHIDLDDEAENALVLLLNYFDGTYITGTLRRGRHGDDGAISIWRIPPIFSPEKWNVFETTLLGEVGTELLNNFVGYHHPTIWTAIDGFERITLLCTMEKDNLGERTKMRVR